MREREKERVREREKERERKRDKDVVEMGTLNLNCSKDKIYRLGLSTISRQGRGEKRGENTPHSFFIFLVRISFSSLSILLTS